MPAAPAAPAERVKSKAEVNLLRLASSFNLTPGDVGGHAAEEGTAAHASEAEPEWRKLEAYARRMQDLLADVRRGNSPPPAELLAEYERMLATAAAAADAARRKQEEPTVTASADGRGRSDQRSAHDGTGARPAEAQPHALAGAPGLHTPVATSLPQSLADRRAQLLGGAQQRLRMGKRGGASAGHGSHLQEQLSAERKMHQRIQEELAGMTGTLKRNVEAMHQTIQTDNTRLATMDDDMAKGIESIARVNVLTDEQRRRNRNTTCLQCGAVLFVTVFFWGTFVLMRLFAKAPVLHKTPLPRFNPPSLTHPGKILIACDSPDPIIHYTTDRTTPSSKSLLFDPARPPMIGGQGETQVEVRAVCMTKKKGFVASDTATVVYTLTGVIEERERRKEEMEKERRQREAAAAAAAEAERKKKMEEEAERKRKQDKEAARVEEQVRLRRQEEEQAVAARRIAAAAAAAEAASRVPPASPSATPPLPQSPLPPPQRPHAGPGNNLGGGGGEF